MQVIENKTDAGKTVTLDDKHFVNCHFTNCTVLYAGGDYGWTDSSFNNCQFRLEGAASRTAMLMGQLGIAPQKPGQVPPQIGGPIN